MIINKEVTALFTFELDESHYNKVKEALLDSCNKHKTIIDKRTKITCKFYNLISNINTIVIGIHPFTSVRLNFTRIFGQDFTLEMNFDRNKKRRDEFLSAVRSDLDSVIDEIKAHKEQVKKCNAKYHDFVERVHMMR